MESSAAVTGLYKASDLLTAMNSRINKIPDFSRINSFGINLGLPACKAGKAIQ